MIQFFLRRQLMQTGTTTAEISDINPQEIFGFDRWIQGIGIRTADDQIPLWISKSYSDKNILVQYLLAAELFYLKEKNVINKLPSQIAHIDEESNPVIAVYHLK